MAFAKLKPIQHLQSFQRLESPKSFRTLATILLVFLITVILCLIFVPWQQTIIGTGRVTVFSPMQRPQNIEAQISGRLKKWHVKEGQAVKQGQVLAELADIDPKFLNQDQAELLEAQKRALILKRSATENRIASLQSQLDNLTRSRSVAVPAAGIKTSQSQDRIIAAQQALNATEQNLRTAQYNYTRLQDLYQKGLRSKRDLELAELERVRAETEVRRAQTAVDIARQDISVAELDQVKVGTDLTASIANISANLANAKEALATTISDIAKLDVDLNNLYNRVEQRKIRAPQTGRVVRLMSLGSQETVSEGDILAVVVPDDQDQAVELYVSDWDAPLLEVGRPVRLQFAGFPAIQFAGWPSIATGTFGGEIAVIDAVDDGKGRYRVLVTPSCHRGEKDELWPSPKNLRPGTAAHGWILLNRVPLWYEIWRQFNGFRPIVQPTSEDTGTEKKDDNKPVKRKNK